MKKVKNAESKDEEKLKKLTNKSKNSINKPNKGDQVKIIVPNGGNENFGIKKQKKEKHNSNSTEVGGNHQDVDAKIEKKKAKKLAKKLKKKEQKSIPINLQENGQKKESPAKDPERDIIAEKEEKKAKKLAKKLKKKEEKKVNLQKNGQENDKEEEIVGKSEQGKKNPAKNSEKAIITQNDEKKAKKLAKKLKKKEQKQLQNNLQQNGQGNDKERKPVGSSEEGKENPAKAPEKNLDAKKEERKAKKLAKKLKRKEEKEMQSNLQEKGVKNKKQKIVARSEEGKENPARDPVELASTIFIGNLPTTVKRVQIAKLFQKLGGVRGIRLRTATGKIFFKHKQRKEAGSLNAYVILNDPKAAEKALQLNGIELKGNRLRVTLADKFKIQSTHDPKRTIFVGNLKYSANDTKLHEIFSNCGEIEYIRCLGNGENGCKGVAYVCFKSPEAVGLALELNETLLDERPIHVERYSTKKLGAKEARDKQQASMDKSKISNAKKRIQAKQQQKETKHFKTEKSFEKKKKSDFHGVKATGLNKKKHNKKQNNQMRDLARKIAPKMK